MTCDELAMTGVGAPVLGVLVAAAVCLLLGLGILLLVRRRAGRTTSTLMVVLILGCGAAAGLVPSAPALASPSDCTTADPASNWLTITQTSTMEGLAPGIAPAEITGRVVNSGPDSTFIAAIEVEISSVSTHPGSPGGKCDATDYALRNPRMTVGQMLGPGGSTTFTGASIGFSNKSSNQDACKLATINLRYTTVPE